MEQAPRRETMTQGEIDALMRNVEAGNITASSPGNMGLAKMARDNFKQLEYAP